MTPLARAFMLGSVLALTTAPSHAVGLEQDLAAAIKVLGLPCGAVVSAIRQAENDHVATCADGNRYRVYVGAGNRLVAQKLPAGAPAVK